MVIKYDKYSKENDISSKKGKVDTPHNNEIKNSTLTHFAYSILEKISRKGDGTSTKSNEQHISGITAGNVTKSRESQKKGHKMKHKK